MNTNNKKAILTFDYEVFMGKETGTIEKCVIKPTELILDVLKKNDARAIFFVDSTWLMFLKENFPADFMIIEEQLKEIIRTGSSVELHLHPQWIEASKEGNSITFKSFSKYKLISLSKNEIHVLFRDSISLLESITNRKISCFRAGGFCIEPFSHVKDAFETFGIRYDFSVAPRTSLKDGNIYDYDFSIVPRLPFYKFGDDIQKPDEKGHYTEITLSTYRNNPAYSIANKILLYLKKDRIYGNGIGLQVRPLLSGNSLKRLIRFNGGILSLDKTSNIFFRYLMMTHFRQSDFLVILSHPKTVSPEGLDNLKFIVKKFKTLNSEDLVSSFS